jgi:hypothetical protein
MFKMPSSAAKTTKPAEQPTPTPATLLSFDQILDKLKEKNPKLAKNADPKQTTRILRNAFAVLAEHLADAPEGRIKIPSLGTFVVRNREAEKDGAKVFVRRVIFRATKPKVKPAK